VVATVESLSFRKRRITKVAAIKTKRIVNDSFRLGPGRFSVAFTAVTSDCLVSAFHFTVSMCQSQNVSITRTNMKRGNGVAPYDFRFKIVDCRLRCMHSLPQGSELFNLKSAF